MIRIRPLTVFDFGKVKVGRKKHKVFTLENEATKGGASVHIRGIGLTGGTNDGEFGQTNNCGTLAPRERCKVKIRFAPDRAGPANAKVHIQSDAANAPLKIVVSGTGE